MMKSTILGDDSDSDLEGISEVIFPPTAETPLYCCLRAVTNPQQYLLPVPQAIPWYDFQTLQHIEHPHLKIAMLR